MKSEGKLGHFKNFQMAGVFAAAALFLSGCVSSATYGTGVSQERQLAGDVLGLVALGQGKKDKEKIDYRERAPLALPSQEQLAALPAPQEAATLPGSLSVSDERDDPEYTGLVDLNGNPIKRSELHKYRLEGSGLQRTKSSKKASDAIDQDDITGRYQTAKEFKEQERRIAGLKQIRAGEQANAASKSRQFLTDPPVEYRKPSDPNYIENAANNPAQLGNKKKKGLCVWPLCRK